MTSSKSRVKNATAVDKYGIHFRSKLELYTYEAFMEAGIPVKYEPKHFTLLPKFEFFWRENTCYYISARLYRSRVCSRM